MWSWKLLECAYQSEGPKFPYSPTARLALSLVAQWLPSSSAAPRLPRVSSASFQTCCRMCAALSWGSISAALKSLDLELAELGGERRGPAQLAANDVGAIDRPTASRTPHKWCRWSTGCAIRWWISNLIHMQLLAKKDYLLSFFYKTCIHVCRDKLLSRLESHLLLSRPSPTRLLY